MVKLCYSAESFCNGVILSKIFFYWGIFTKTKFKYINFLLDGGMLIYVQIFIPYSLSILSILIAIIPQINKQYMQQMKIASLENLVPGQNRYKSA
jgi:hypothetical protein